MGFIVKKIKYKFVFLRKEYSTMNVVRVLVKKIPEKLLRIGNKTFNVDLEFPTYNVKNFRVFFIDFETGSQMLFSHIEAKIKPNDLDLIVSNKIIKEIASGVLDDKKTKLMMILLGAVIGGLLAYIIVSNIYQKKINDLYEEMRVITIGVM